MGRFHESGTNQWVADARPRARGHGGKRPRNHLGDPSDHEDRGMEERWMGRPRDSMKSISERPAAQRTVAHRTNPGTPAFDASSRSLFIFASASLTFIRYWRRPLSRVSFAM